MFLCRAELGRIYLFFAAWTSLVRAGSAGEMVLMLRCHLTRRGGFFFFFFFGGPRGTRQRGWKLAISFISPRNTSICRVLELA